MKRAHHPQDLEAGLELGQQAPLVGGGGVALHEGIEGQLGRRRRDPHGSHHQQGAAQASGHGGHDGGDGGRGQAGDQHLVLFDQPAELGREGRAGQVAQPGGHQDETVGRRRPTLRAQLEGQQEGQEADDAAEQPHRGNGQPQALHGGGRVDGLVEIDLEVGRGRRPPVRPPGEWSATSGGGTSPAGVGGVGGGTAARRRPGAVRAANDQGAMAGNRRDSTVAATNGPSDNTTTAGEPNNQLVRPAGKAPMGAARAARSASLELARTSSVSLRTVAGT